VDVGCQGRISDGGIYRNSSFKKALDQGHLNLPDPAPLPTSSDPLWMHDENKTTQYRMFLWQMTRFP